MYIYKYSPHTSYSAGFKWRAYANRQPNVLCLFRRMSKSYDN